jgi:hypothetical protein
MSLSMIVPDGMPRASINKVSPDRSPQTGADRPSAPRSREINNLVARSFNQWLIG